jgi:hypothetical protein
VRQRGVVPREARPAPTPAPRIAPQIAQEPRLPPPAPPPARERRPIESSPAMPREASDSPAVAVGETAAPAKEGETAGMRDRAAAPESKREMPRSAVAAPGPGGAGGEGDVAARSAPAPAPLHLSITEIDGFGAPPALVSGVRIDLPASERGREYVLRVDSQGTVRDVSRADSQDSGRFADAPRRRVAKADSAAPPPLSRLRFEPGNKPRRLLVRID